MTNDTNAYLRQLKWDDKLAVATTIEQMPPSFESMAYCFDYFENFYEYSLSILMRKDFPLSAELNEFIQQASDNGFIAIWLKQNQLQSPIQTEIDKKEFQPVNMDTMYYLVIFYLVISVGLLLIVTAERFIYEKVRCENSAKIWRVLEMAIDPYRYLFLCSEKICA